MNILVLKSHKLKYDTEFLSTISSYGEATGNSYTMDYLENLEFSFVGKELEISIGDIDVRTFDFVFFRTWHSKFDAAASLSVFLKKNGIKFVDSSVGEVKMAKKILQYVTLKYEDFTLIPSVVLHTNRIKDRVEDVAEQLGGFPIVVKHADMDRGNGVFLINRKEDLSVLETLKPGFLFVQKNIPNNSDYRVVVFGGKTVVIKKRIRQNPDEFRNNVSLGAKVEYLEPLQEEELCKISEDSAKAMLLEVAGVDIITSTEDGKNYILEVNCSPEFHNDFSVLEHLNKMFSRI